MFFLRTWRTLSINPEKTQPCPATTKPRNGHYWLLKHALLSQQVWTKKYKSIKIKYEISNKKKTINLKQPTCSCNMDSKLIFETHFVHEHA
jgi:hypothetical protein